MLRHTTAMELLQAGVDRSVIALWLGHESVETTQIYLDANLALKEDALKKTSPLNARVGRFKPDDQLLPRPQRPELRSLCGFRAASSSKRRNPP